MRNIEVSGASPLATPSSHRCPAQRAPASGVLRPASGVLRAAFLQRVVSSVYTLNEPVILDGAVTSKVAQADRNAELVVFLNG